MDRIIDKTKETKQHYKAMHKKHINNVMSKDVVATFLYACSMETIHGKLHVYAAF